jgi:hypothetical protein
LPDATAAQSESLTSVTLSHSFILLEIKTMSTVEQLKARKALLEKRIAKIKARQNVNQRRADLHLKASLGGAVLIALDNPKLPATIKVYLLKTAENGVQRTGFARQRFEGLKARHIPQYQAIEPQAAIL